MLAAVFVDETLAKKIKYEPALTQILGVDSDIGIFAPITCVDENPFPDPSDTYVQTYIFTLTLHSSLISHNMYKQFVLYRQNWTVLLSVLLG